MERSSSEPVLRQEDYYVPCHGVGETGPANRVTHGPMSKDTGIFSSRINQIVRQAEKVPGPDKYLAHEDWGLTRSNAFAKGDRSYKQMNKVPEPARYERQDFFEKCPNACKDVLSQNPRIIHGKIPKGKRRSFLDYAIKHGSEIPDPGTSAPLPKSSDRLDVKLKGTLDWNREKQHHESKKKPETSIGPDHYTPGWAQLEERPPNYSVPKEVGKNFVSKAVGKTVFISTTNKKAEPVPSRPAGGNFTSWKEVTKEEKPGPCHYELQNFDLHKTSRGTYHLQLRGLSRSSTSGFF